jgi:hypothetical protein
MQRELFPSASHVLLAVDSGQKDFIVYNDRELSDEPIDSSRLQYGTMKGADQQRSEAWSSKVSWFFVVQYDGIYLLSAKDERCIFCPQLSWRFMELFLNAR